MQHLLSNCWRLSGASKLWQTSFGRRARILSLQLSVCIVRVRGRYLRQIGDASAKREMERERRRGGEGQNKDGDGSEKRLQQLTLIKCASVYVSCGDISVV